jgi:RNA polymerase sigma-70 factor (ECF subfamily)
LKYLKNREESRDAVLNLFEKLLEDLKHHSVDNFKSWIHSVARNHCLMILRKVNRPGFEKDIDELQEKLHDAPESDVQLKEEQLQSLEKVIPLLNEEQRICIELFYLKDLSYQEVMQETGFTMNQVKSNIQNGKRNLKILLTKQNEIFVK